MKVPDTIYDTSGGKIGTITTMSGTSAVIDTGANRVTFPAHLFGPGAKGPVLAAPKAQVDAFGTQADDTAKARLTEPRAGSPSRHVNRPYGSVAALTHL